jgi:hypothetical protein
MIELSARSSALEAHSSQLLLDSCHVPPDSCSRILAVISSLRRVVTTTPALKAL